VSRLPGCIDNRKSYYVQMLDRYTVTGKNMVYISDAYSDLGHGYLKSGSLMPGVWVTNTTSLGHGYLKSGSLIGSTGQDGH
jgi:hypothetical protein